MLIGSRQKARKAGVLVMFIIAAALGWFLFESAMEALDSPTVVKNIITGRAVVVHYKDGTSVHVTRLTKLPEKYNVVWEDPGATK